MKIQWIRYDNRQTLKTPSIEETTLNAPRSLDEFDVNIIDLSSELIWTYAGDHATSIDCINDFISISQMVKNRRKSLVIYALPQNANFDYSRSSGHFFRSIQLKDQLSIVTTEILNKALCSPLTKNSLLYENTRTVINDVEFEAAFYFGQCSTALTRSISSEKVTTIKLEEMVFATTLDITATSEQLLCFVKMLLEPVQKEKIPEWIKDVAFFDDELQKQAILENEQKIDEAHQCIDVAQKKLEKNLEYKSIVYTNGKELVEVVFEILEQLLKCDLSDFKDEMKEDFLIKVGGVTFVGEIKGINSNIKSENISQTDVHYHGYLDSLAEQGISECVRQILIINPFRNKQLEEREPAHETQIRLAKRNGCIVLVSSVLLRIFERFLEGAITSEECIRVLSSSEGGLLELNSFVR